MMYNPETETLSPEALEALQTERLRKLVAYLTERNALYRERFQKAGITPDSIQSMKDIVKLPFTTKEDLHHNYPFGMLCIPREQVAEIHMSSGTKGNPTVMGYSKNDLDLWSKIAARTMACAGLNKGDLVQIAKGYGLFTGGFGAHYGSLELGATVIPVSSGHTARQISLMKLLKPRVLACTSGYALRLAEEAAMMNLDPREISWEIAIVGAEPLSPKMRAEVEKRLGVVVSDTYGMTEVIGLGVTTECEAHDGLHIWSDVFYPEVIDPETGQPVEPGQSGELVITTLTKEAMPIVRYRTRDIVSMTYEKCTCGRTMPRVKAVEKRADDMIVIKGVNLYPSQIEHIIEQVGDKISPNYRIVLDRNSKGQDILEILAETSDVLSEDELRALQARMLWVSRSNLAMIPKITLVPPQTIERPEGKTKRVIDKRAF